MAVGMESPPPSTAEVADGVSEAARRRRPAHYVEAWALVVLTLLLILFFSFLPATSGVFPTTANLRVTMGGQSVLIVVAMAALLPLVCGQYDFAVGAVAGMSALFAASALSGGAPITVAVLLAAGLGLAVGAVNGFLVTVVRIDSVVATLGMSTIVTGIVRWKSGGVSVVEGIPASLTDLGTNTTFGIPHTLYLALAVVLLVYYVLRQTPIGRYFDAIGSNPRAARLIGLSTSRLTMASFLAAGLLAGLAGMLQVAVSGSGNPLVGPGFTLPAIAAAFLSVAAITPGRFNVGGTVVAITFLAILNSGLNLAGASPFVSDFANGGALIVGVAVAALLGRQRNRFDV
jgi:ribose transport system permease protein